ncbi:hypothetical protein LIER_34402 [Lithospermum erythrorhizon]|uniref:Transmembrane protein n=1 Tax=Lithospermum erythrorhizon TaxID=34254 RepID=A0AAV3S2W0_LITER
MATSSEDINLSLVLSETRRIINAYRNHFSILSVLFLLPFFILLFLYPTTFLNVFESNDCTKSLFLLVLYFVVAFVFSISATGTFTYSAFHGYYNRPLKLITTLKSLSSSFIPLCSTLLVLQLIIFSIGFLIGILGYFIYTLVDSNDENGSHNSRSFIWTLILVDIVMLMVLVCIRYLQVNLIIANVIVVVESKWGYEPLRRSSYLMKGLRTITLKINMLFGLVSCVFVYGFYWSSWTSDTDTLWVWISKMVAGSCGMTMLVEYSLIANVVMYIYSMKMKGELGVEIQGDEYVSLNIGDDGNMFI